jgi:hypothetical protein
MQYRRWCEDVMRRRQVLVAGAAAAVLLGTGCAQAAPATTTAMPSTTPVATSAAAAGAAGVLGRAIAVPGLAALNKGRHAEVLSVSCAAPGSCAAVGFYTDGGGHQQGFVASQRSGRWRQAIEVPGLGALNKGRKANVSSVSCASSGHCVAGGFYRNRGKQGFVVVEKDGRWRQAVEVPGLGALNAGGNAKVSSVSCDSRGYCVAGGFYQNRGKQGFVAVQETGIWRRAVEVPGLGALNAGGYAEVGSVSCASPGNCAAGGVYDTHSAGAQQGFDQHAFVVSEQNGSWGTAQQVAANLSTGPGGDAGVDTVSCGSPGNCAAAGWYSNASGDQAFVISEVNGTWAAAQVVAGTLSSSGGARVTSVSCASAGNCAAGGQFDYGGYNAAFLVNEKNGAWGKLIYVPGLNAVSRDAYLNSVSCASPGNCAAAGDYDLGVFVAIEKNGVWAKETTVPGALPVKAVNSVSCASAGSCVAGGFYLGPGQGYAPQGFVT